MGAKKRPTLTVVYAATALKELDEIWAWNNQRHGSEHAHQYVEFLERHVSALIRDHRLGKKLGFRPELSYILIRRKSKGHGHVAVYSVDEKQVHVFHVFHSAQDGHSKLQKEVSGG